LPARCIVLRSYLALIAIHCRNDRVGSNVLLKNVEDRSAIGAETAQKHDEKRCLFFAAYLFL
jgi:hypothetical protein